MRKLLAGLVVLVVFGLCASSYGAIRLHRVLVYKGTMKAAKTVYDVTDLNDLLSGSVPMYLAVDVCDGTGAALDSNSVIYNKSDKLYQLYPDAVSISPSDPNHVVLLRYSVDGAFFQTVGTGKLTKVYDSNKADANTTAKYPVTPKLKGAGYCNEFIVLDTEVSGSLTMDLKLDSKLTKQANSDDESVNDAINGIVEKLTAKGDWEKVPTPD